MATTLYLLSTPADTHLGTDNTILAGSALGWDTRALGTARGSGVASVSTSTAAGPTSGLEVNLGSWRGEWISPPVSEDVTIAGSIFGNIWASESAMTSNVAINVLVEVLRANVTGTRNSNTIVQIVKTARTTEVAVTTRAVNNFTATPTSTVVNRGDRLRVRVFADDSIDGNMASGGTFSVSWNGTTASADGDTWVSFTENFSFESAPGVLRQSLTDGGFHNFMAVTNQKAGQPFVAQGSSLSEVRAWLWKTGAPDGDALLTIQTDSSGAPTGSVVGTVATVTAASLTTTSTEYTYSTAISLTPGVTYWLVYEGLGTLSNTDHYRYHTSITTPSSGFLPLEFYNGSSWGTVVGKGAATVSLTMSTSVLYLTDTASDVATASVDREAWTSRGAGVQTDVRNTAAGWTVPLQLTDTAGGTVVDWFTKQLTAFTLTGMAVGNIRALQSSATANASLRCEIARVESDGTSPTVWASWCIAPITTDTGELGTTEVARTCNISGDDLAISNGQRLRIRIYIEDSASTPLTTALTTTVYYAGTSAAASGDTYITLPVTVTEYSPGGGAPGPASSRRQRRASRYLTFR